LPNNPFINVKSLLTAVGCLAALSVWSLRAQASTPSPLATPDAGPPPLPQNPNATPAPTPANGPQALPENSNSSPTPNPAASPGSSPDAGLPPLPQAPDATSPALAPPADITPSPTPVRRNPSAEPGDPTLNTSNSFWLDNYPLNDLLQYLARQADYQYFQNTFIDPIKVTGQLFKGRNPIDNMRELALQYNLVLYQKGRTIYALSQDQIATLPQKEFRYELKYLHPKPEDIQRMLGHFLTPERGSATLEQQINTLIVSDNETVISKISRYLQSIDVPRRQISIQVRVISLTTTGDKFKGIDWSSTLGQSGMNISASAQSNLDAAFGFRPSKVTGSPSGSTATATAVSLPNEGTNVILGPVTVSAVLHALYDNSKAHEESAPLVITEDNQPSTVRVVTRTPIITSTVTSTTAGPDISNEVRYFLDPSDVQKGREIGTTLLVTPSILPDNTIRLQIDGTVATVVSQVTATTGTGSNAVTNTYPVVNEAHLVNLSRVPSGYSLILGGFTTINNTVQSNRVPVLSSIPLLGKAFRYNQTNRSRTNLAFVITPIAFEAGNPDRAVKISEYNRGAIIGPEHDISDPDLIGRIHENPADLRNALATGQFQESDKNPVKKRKKSPAKKKNPSDDDNSIPRTPTEEPDNGETGQ
jgi:hypothetical protein